MAALERAKVEEISIVADAFELALEVSSIMEDLLRVKRKDWKSRYVIKSMKWILPHFYSTLSAQDNV